MNSTFNTTITLISGAALVLFAAALANAQEATPDAPKNQAHTQAQTMNGQRQTQPSPTSQGAARRLGPGDGSGNQGIGPRDCTGNGSPDQVGTPSGKHAKNGKAAKKSKATTNGTSSSGPSGADRGTLTRTRARDLSGSGTGTCTGSGAGSRHGARGSGGSRNGGRR